MKLEIMVLPVADVEWPRASAASSAGDSMPGAQRRAPAAYGRHENHIGAAGLGWPDWRTASMAAEQTGTELPR